MNKNFILAAACCLPLSLLAQKGFTIHGKVGSQNAPAQAYLIYNNDNAQLRDSVVLKQGEFTFKGRVSYPTNATIYIKHDTVTRPRFSLQDEFDFYLENSDISVTAKDSVRYAAIKGSVTEDDQRKLYAMQRPYKHSADSLVAVYNKMTPVERKDSSWIKAAQKIMTVTQKGYDSVTRAFIAQYPNSYIALMAFKQVELAYNFNPDTAEARFAKFPASQRTSVYGKKLAEIIDKGKKTNAGVMAMDFTQKDSTGKTVKLSDFRGHYVLLDFWASWCKPCRAENPNYLKAYNKYKDRNFTILGVSLDDSATKKAWLKAVQVDNLPWTQISDLQGFKSKAAVMYGVEAIPSNFLIDPNGKIIAKNLRGEELDKKLSELFPGTAQTRYTISGSITGLATPSKVYLSYGQGKDEFIDSSVIEKNGSFRFAGNVREPILAFLAIRPVGQARSRKEDYTTFYLENANISIVAVDSIKNAMVKGSQADREERELEASIRPLTNTIIRLQDAYHGKPKDEAYKRAGDTVTQMVAAIKDLHLQFAKNHLNTFMGLQTFYYYVLDSKFIADSVQPLYDQFSPEMKNSPMGKLAQEKIDIGRRRQTGVVATDFTQTDLDGNPFTLSSLRGKYVLVDFWASWCVPCRAENPNLRIAYEKLKSEKKNFEVVGVSLDQGKAPWAEAVKHDSLPWIHVCDLQGWKNAVAQLYGISAVPQNLLIDPKGMIIARNLPGEDLYKKLEALIN